MTHVEISFEADRRNLRVVSLYLALREMRRNVLVDRSFEAIHTGPPTPCLVCLEDIAPQDPIKLLPCTHEFHRKCISEWFQRKTTCPTCRGSLTAKTTDRRQL